MGKFYRTREGSITAVDTRTALTTLASATAESPSSIVVPKGATKLHSALVAVGPDFAAAGSATFFFRLEGDGLVDSPLYGPIDAAGGSVATGARAAIPAQRIPLDADVIPGNTIAVSAEMAGADIGTVAVGVTLIFTS